MEEDGPCIPRPGLKAPSEFDKEAILCRDESLRLFNKYGYSALLNRPRANEPSWALGWNGRKTKIASQIAKCYGHIVSRYYHGVLPQYRYHRLLHNNIIIFNFELLQFLNIFNF